MDDMFALGWIELESHRTGIIYKCNHNHIQVNSHRTGFNT